MQISRKRRKRFSSTTTRRKRVVVFANCPFQHLKNSVSPELHFKIQEAKNVIDPKGKLFLLALYHSLTFTWLYFSSKISRWQAFGHQQRVPAHHSRWADSGDPHPRTGDQREESCSDYGLHRGGAVGCGSYYHNHLYPGHTGCYYHLQTVSMSCCIFTLFYFMLSFGRHVFKQQGWWY